MINTTTKGCLNHEKVYFGDNQGISVLNHYVKNTPICTVDILTILN